MLFKSHGVCWPFRFTRKLTLLDEAANSPQTFVGEVAVSISVPFSKPLQCSLNLSCVYPISGLSGTWVGLLNSGFRVFGVLSGVRNIHGQCGSDSRSLYTAWVDCAKLFSLLNVPALSHFPKACYSNAPTRKLGLYLPPLSHGSILIHKPSGGEREAKSNESAPHPPEAS